jgi:hypothetical protein
MGDIQMYKSVCVLAILAAAVSTAAVAKDLKQDKKATVPTVAAAQMTDAEMDKVTAGAAVQVSIFNPGQASLYHPGRSGVCINSGCY